MLSGLSKRGIKEVNYHEDGVEFDYAGHKIRVKIEVK